MGSIYTLWAVQNKIIFLFEPFPKVMSNETPGIFKSVKKLSGFSSLL